MTKNEESRIRQQIFLSEKLRPAIREAVLSRIRMMRDASVDDETIAKFVGDYCATLVALAILSPDTLLAELPE